MHTPAPHTLTPTATKTGFIVSGVIRAVAFVAALFFISGCAQPLWEYSEADSWQKEHQSGRVLYVEKSPSVPQIEILKLAGGRHVSLLLRSRPAKTGAVTASIDGENHSMQLTLLNGGQVLRFSEKDAETIISALLENRTVSFHLPGYRGTIDPEGFQAAFQQLR